MILDKKQMTEEDIKLQYITPAIQAKWDSNHITMETRITDGRINIRGNLIHRERPKKADYVLWLNKHKPIAIVEAKDNNHSVSFGLQQAMEYAQMLDVPFAYSSNGDGFQEHDFLTGMERTLALDEFPTVIELTARWEQNTNGGQGVSENEKKIIAQPYYSSQTTYDPRYYQRNAINRTVEAIAKGQQRVLLVMATGTGKTYTAFQIVYRLLTSELKRKVLYLADRNILVDQSIQQDFAPLEKTIHKINFAKDDPVTITSHEVFFSLYQQLTSGDDKEDEENGEEAVARFAQLFNKDFFDLIIVDECHRGSAKKDSNWRKILDYFSSAAQIGMTATPKETKYISNIDYFGEPIYTYSLREGIDDGFLAPFKVINVHTNIGEGWRPYKGQLDKFGNPIEDRIYTNSDFDYNIIIEGRIQEVAAEITAYLKATDRMQKTIVFCANEAHAENMRIALTNLNADMCRENPDYVVRITSSDVYGKRKIKQFISVTEKYPTIATTSKLLSTGADCKMTKLIVLDEMISSMTEFKQIIGRGTRLRVKDGKDHFIVMDFRNVTRLFADPDWDGHIEMLDNYDPNPKKKPKEPTGDPTDPPVIIDPPEPSKKPIVDANGCEVRILGKTVAVYDVDGKLLRQESIVDYTKSNILGDYANMTLDSLENKLLGVCDNIQFIRYADDIIIISDDKNLLSDTVMNTTSSFLAERGLRLSERKTSLIHIEDGFDFLGWNVRRYGDDIYLKPSEQNINQLFNKVSAILTSANEGSYKSLRCALRRCVAGWINYHRGIVIDYSLYDVEYDLVSFVYGLTNDSVLASDIDSLFPEVGSR